MTGDKSAFWTTVWRAVGVLAVFALLTTLHTWPLVPQFSARISPNGDVPVNVWGLNDLAGQILNDPKHLLDGRIHYPYPHTLAFVDHQIASALLALPLVASGRDAITIYNVVFLASFWLSGVFCYLLVRDLTGSVGAGLVAGSLLRSARIVSITLYIFISLAPSGSPWPCWRCIVFLHVRPGCA